MCEVCNEYRETPDQAYSWTLPLRTDVKVMSIEDCLQHSSHWEDNDDLKCKHCGARRMKMATYLKEAPLHLIVKLGRAQDPRTGEKTMTKVTLPFGEVDLTIGPALSDPKASRYEMSGVIKHRGRRFDKRLFICKVCLLTGRQ